MLLVLVLSTVFFAVENVGNYYSNIFKSSQEAALHMSSDLASTVQAISSWHSSMILDNSTDPAQTLPVWLQDVLVNGLSFWRTGLYLRDGRWRQFEALDCIDMDSVHNDFQREIPYVLFYPDLVKNVMRAWAEYQSSDGHIVETLAAGCYSPTRKIDRLVSPCRKVPSPLQLSDNTHKKGSVTKIRKSILLKFAARNRPLEVIKLSL